MPRNVSPYKLGLFVLLCGGIGTAALIWLGASHLFEKTSTYVSYFDESVKGLQKDAIINYRGVAVGRVFQIQLAQDGRLIEVVLSLRPDFHVDESVSIQLREQGLTGMRYLEIDKAPHNLAALTPKIEFTPPHPLIRSQPSEIEQLKLALQDLYGKVTQIDLKRLTDSWTGTADLINVFVSQITSAIEPHEWRQTVQALRSTAVDTADFMKNLSSSASPKVMKKSFEDMGATLEATRKATETLASQLKTLSPDTLSRTIQQWNSTVKTGETTLANLDRRVEDSTAVLQQNLVLFRQLLQQLNTLVQGIGEQPGQLIQTPTEEDPFRRKNR